MFPYPLKDLAARQGFRVFADESADLDSSHTHQAWCVQLRGPYGFVQPHSATELLAVCESVKQPKRDQLRAVEGVRVHQDGDRELSAIFIPDPPSRLEAIADILDLRRKRQVSQTTLDRLAKTAFRPKAHAVATA